MRQVLARLLPLTIATLAAGAAVAQPLTENFDDVSALAAAGWVVSVNGSPAGLTGWFQGNPAVFSSQSGVASSYVAANLNGAAFGGNVSTWLISPTLSNLQNGEVLSFYTRTEPSAPAADRLEVRLSLNGSSTNVGATDASVGDFTLLALTVNPALTVGGYPTIWTRFAVTLSGLPAGPSTGRIAFRHAVPDTATNADVIAIDTLNLTLPCPPPPPLVVSAPAIVGAGSPNRVASVAAIAGATYAWGITNGILTAGQGTNQITFTAGTSGSVGLTVDATNAGCPAGSAAASVPIAPAGGAVQFYTLPPCRVLDTRNPAGPLGGPALAPAGGVDRSFAVAGVCGIPTGAVALSLNVTVTNTAGAGWLLLYRGDGPASATSTINFGAGQTRANNAHVQLATDGSGTFRIQNGSGGTVDVVVDVNGYYQ